MLKHGVFCVPEVRCYEHERLANGRAHLVMLTEPFQRFYERWMEKRINAIKEELS